MAIGRIPGPLGDTVGTKVVRSSAALGSSPREFKPVPKGIDAWILFPPPRFRQMQIYKGTEGLYGCWATVAEMIIKERNSGAPFKRPVFEHLLFDTSAQGRIRYMDFVNDTLAGWGFEPLPGGMMFEWETSTVASSVKLKGPLLCMGQFFEGWVNPLQIGGDMHCIAVFGGQDEIVYYRDPMDGTIKTMPLHEFNHKGRIDPFLRRSNVRVLKPL